MRRTLTPCAALLALALLGAPALAAAQTVTLKLGTLAPDGSTWHVLLKEMGERWSEVSGGRVKLKVYAGGVAGDEGDMVRKMRVGQLNAAALSVLGLRDIDSSPQAIATPGLIESEEEWNHVFSRAGALWDKRFADKGFVPLIWGDTGTIYMFFKNDVRSPAQMKGVRVYAWSGDPAALEAWKVVGFQPVVLSITDLLPSLTTGMIDGFASIPMMAFAARWYERAPFMLDAPWGHMPGATVVKKDVWDKIPADLQPKLLEIAREYGAKVNADAQRQQAEAVAQMKKAGLQVVTLAPADLQAWREMQQRTWKLVRGCEVGAPASECRGGATSAEAFDEVKRARDEFRAGRPGGAARKASP
jgi:TRAP-type C4-dicarboxylate transport system substrate-binding protein